MHSPSTMQCMCQILMLCPYWPSMYMVQLVAKRGDAPLGGALVLAYFNYLLYFNYSKTCTKACQLFCIEIFRTIRNVKRSLQWSWLEKHPWMRYSVAKDAVFCAPCVLFGPQRHDTKEKTFSLSSPVTDWGNLSRCVTRHLNESSKHHDNVLAATEFLRITSGIKSDILESMSESFNARIKRNREILSCIIDAILLCGKQNLAIRGHEEKNSNLVAILHMRAKDNAILADHLAFADPQKKYTSPDIQNEIIGLCADQIISALVQDCNDSRYFGFISDEATDCSTKEQASICVRFFDKMTKSVREEFLGFAEASRTTGEVLAELFLEQLELKGVNVDQMRAQGYDGAANMSGVNKGVQSRIKERILGAQYVHCKAHNLNLSIVHASEEPLIRNLMDTVRAIAFAFDYSAKRLLSFKENLEQNVVVKEEMERRQKLKTLCETRWASRSESLFTFLTAFKVVVDSLENLEQQGDSKARSYACSIKKFDFIITLVAAQSILQPLVPLSEMLQSKTVDLIEAVSESRVVIEQLNRKRNSQEAWDELFEKAVKVADTVEEVPTMPRGAGRQRHRVNVPAETPSQYWKRAMFLPFLDHLIQELTRRLVSNEERFSEVI